MKRKQAVFTIEGTDFAADIDRMALVQIGNSANEISFINDMKDLGTHYQLLYLPDKISAAQALFDKNKVVEIRVPPLVQLDPEGMAEKYGCPIADLAGKTDFEVMVDQELLGRRLAGELPQIEICGDKYFVDLRLNQLRHEDFNPQINMKRLDLSSDGTTYQAFYQPLIKQVVEPDHNLTAIPEGLVMIEIPNELKLDPVGAARKYGLEEKDVLRMFPIQKELKAKQISVEDTGLPALVQRNRQNQQQEEKQQRNRKKLRPKF
ncbi:hypothetical protein SAMN05216464_113148 [Mucilaginibacter pineti]|uniref:Uncharacterized protein n=1 Tax=Mucilaginibacter pineti TaxID=1391627 RepID=A0A1G7ISW6_9SPHI|nr:hypothetical protein [Mucilaginibacter pineti]SDF15698.1 hypothetical protein SAMN05216464_113148 [Mucilaginibacter pineti]